MADLDAKTSGKPRVLLSAGEASGDAVGAALINEMRQLGVDAEFHAIGASKLRSAGAEIIADSSSWGAIGIFHSLLVVPRVYRDMRKVTRWLRHQKPRLVIAIDFGYVNIRLSRIAKRIGSKTLYFMPPGSWRRQKQGVDLPKIADRIATPFKWSNEMLLSMGGVSEWVGHPIVQICDQFEEADRSGIAILPGSRLHEIEFNLPVIAQAVERLGNSALPATIVVAPTADPEKVSRMWSAHSRVPVELSAEPAPHTLKRAAAAIVCSGTAALECAVCDCPMVVVYRGSKLLETEVRIRRPRFEFVAMPSIIMQKKVVTELLMWNVTPDAVYNAAYEVLFNEDVRAQQLNDFQEIRRMLGPRDAITRTAKIAAALLEDVE